VSRLKSDELPFLNIFSAHKFVILCSADLLYVTFSIAYITYSSFNYNSSQQMHTVVLVLQYNLCIRYYDTNTTMCICWLEL